MLPPLGQRGQRALGPLCDRWIAFVTRLRARIQEVLGEADAGMGEIIAMDPLNYGAVSAGLSGVGSRLQALGSKVQEAEEKLGAEWDEKNDDADLEGAEAEAARRAWHTLVAQSRALQHDIEKAKELFEISAGAAWARTLHPLAEVEMSRERQCSHCGGPMAPALVHAASNTTCGHCGAVSTLEVGPATGMYIEGGIHNLAREHAREAWVAQFDAEKAYHAIRDQTPGDRASYLGAVRTYWTVYYTAFARMHPGMNRTIDESVAAKMAHHERWR